MKEKGKNNNAKCKWKKKAKIIMQNVNPENEKGF